MTIEDFGTCRLCGKQAVLSDGLCILCRDREIKSTAKKTVPEHKESYDDFVDKLGRKWRRRERGWAVSKPERR